MSEHEYPDGHPANREVRGKNMVETRTGFEYDYKPNHPARGGQGQPVPTHMGGKVPMDGYKHLFGLPGPTLKEAQEQFNALPATEQDARHEYNKSGVPAELLEEG